MNRSQKEELVLKMRHTLQQASGVIVASQSGLSVEEITQLRCDMREAGAEFKVLKNTLAQLAVKGTFLEGINAYLQGPTALGYSQDYMAAAKIMSKFADKNSKLSLLGGYMDGQVLDANAIKILANLPSLDELRGRIIALLKASSTKLAILVQKHSERLPQE